LKKQFGGIFCFYLIRELIFLISPKASKRERIVKMAMNSVGMQPQSFKLPPRAPKKEGEAPKKPSFQKLAAYEIGDKYRFNPAGEQIKVSKGDDSNYWTSLGYDA
jgi:hypothetical protein